MSASTTQSEVERFEAALLKAPFHRWLGLRVKSVSSTMIEIILPGREELVSSPQFDATHGGILATLIDLTGLYAVRVAGGNATSTLDLHVDYLKTAKSGPLTAVGKTVKLGRRVSVAETKVYDSAGVMVAAGRGAYVGRD